MCNIFGENNTYSTYGEGLKDKFKKLDQSSYISVSYPGNLFNNNKVISKSFIKKN